MQLLQPRLLLAHAIQILLFLLKVIQLNLCLMRDFTNINVMKCDNGGYGV